MIDRVSKAQALADAARLKALQDYLALLGKAETKISPQTSPLVPGLDYNPSQNADRNYDLLNPPVLSPAALNSMAGITFNPSQNADRNYDITITAGIGDPEAIARAVEDVLNQSTYRGTTVNRGAGRYYE
jgi:hypothetical protein